MNHLLFVHFWNYNYRNPISIKYVDFNLIFKYIHKIQHNKLKMGIL